MAGESNRTRRVGEQMQRELAIIIQQELSDPRVEWVTVSAVKVSKDLQNAKVYITVLGDDQALEAALKVLNKISGFLRHELGRRMRLRIMPQLTFIYDESIARGNRLSRLIDQAVTRVPGDTRERGD